ncbi:MAG TPA: 23S rRNA (guanosine(2251)-2'-O)-methyltransferase RlmB [Clostridiales bacterium]|nr:23S rRNA (guanosine(2251)-2'-O)-methyltransferase RlmB [Eubacteriales bacterium]HBR32143.1 23S rRNA (guanosine(2251)-2'-O)-methyltransferase RlmB [Clostridiales bacterium]
MSNYKNKSGYYGNKNGDISGSTEDNGGNDNVFIGRNAVLELLKSGREIDKLYVQKGEREGSITLIVARAAESRIPVVEVDKHRLDKMSAGGVHQGVAAIASETAYVSVEDILAIAAERGEKPFIVICDSINDPHNLGAIIRTAECAGVHGVIIPKRRAVSVNGAAAKASAGAVFHMAVARVSNLSSAMRTLRDNNVWIYALESDGTPYYKSDFDCACAFVLGGENSGVTRLVRDNSDFVISVPMYGKINSLNVSNAGAVVLFEAARQRTQK